MLVKPSVVAIALLAFMPLSQAATVQVSWGDPAKFRDIRAGDENQIKYQERVMKELETAFQHEAALLPTDQTLKIEIKDLDLAGELEYFHGGFPFGIRIVRNMDFPSMELSYELRDSKSQVLKSGDSKISDMGFRDGIQPFSHNEPLRYEIKLIKQWYKREIMDSRPQPSVSMR